MVQGVDGTGGGPGFGRAGRDGGGEGHGVGEGASPGGSGGATSPENGGPGRDIPSADLARTPVESDHDAAR
eukprot:9164155-Lingulodinium_polyedra.AAC.1